MTSNILPLSVITKAIARVLALNVKKKCDTLSASCCVAKLLARQQWLQVLPLEQQALLLQWHRHIIMFQKLSKAKRN